MELNNYSKHCFVIGMGLACSIPFLFWASRHLTILNISLAPGFRVMNLVLTIVVLAALSFVLLGLRLNYKKSHF